MNYKTITLKDLVTFVQGNPTTFPEGLNTVLLSGDFEGNYTHKMHEGLEF